MKFAGTSQHSTTASKHVSPNPHLHLSSLGVYPGRKKFFFLKNPTYSPTINQGLRGFKKIFYFPRLLQSTFHPSSPTLILTWGIPKPEIFFFLKTPTYSPTIDQGLERFPKIFSSPPLLRSMLNPIPHLHSSSLGVYPNPKFFFFFS